jgi:hypothetical protein
MADNTTTYKAVIETEVKGQKSVDDMNKSIEEGGDKFKSLRSQIRETTVKLQELADAGKVGSKEFKELSKQLDDLGDQQKKVAFQSGQIEDKLSALPGPIGQIGKGFASAKEAVDTFGVNLAIATGGITLIIGAIIAMKEAMSKTKEGNDALNKVTEAFGKIMAPIFALFEKVGIPLFLKFAEVVEWVAGKVNKFVQFLGVSQNKIQEIATNGNKAFYDAAQKDLDNMKVVQDMIKAQDEKAKQAATERNRKYLEKKAEQEKEAWEAEKKLVDDQLKYYDAQKKKREKLNADPIGSDGLTAKQREAALKAEEAYKKYFAEKIAKNTESLNKKLADGTIKLAKTTSLTIEADAKNSIDKRTKLEKFLTSEKKKNLDTQLVAAKAALELAGGLVDEHSAAGKAIAVTLAVINTYQGATAALASLPPPFSFIAAAATVAAGLLNVNKILSTPIPSAKSGGGDVGAGVGGGNVDIAAPTIPQINAPDINVSGGQNPTSAIAGTLAAASGRPIKAYVVSTDMSSAQALDRRTNRAATLSGG